MSTAKSRPLKSIARTAAEVQADSNAIRGETEPDTSLGHWYTDKTVDVSLPGLHYAVRISVQYGRSACGDVFKPGELDDDTVKERCSNCADAIERTLETLPTDADDARAYVVATLAAVLSQTGWRKIGSNVHMPVTDLPTARQWARVMSTGTASRRSRRGARNETPVDPPVEPVEQPEETPAVEPTPITSARSKRSKKADAAPPPPPPAATNGGGKKNGAKNGSKTTVAPEPDDTGASVDAALRTSKDIYAAWKPLNEKRDKLKKEGVTAGDKRYDKLTAQMSAMSKAYRIAKKEGR